MEEKLVEGTKVTVTLKDGVITGEICGISSNELPTIGYTYIIKITQRSGKAFEDYPYSCLSFPRCLIHVSEKPV